MFEITNTTGETLANNVDFSLIVRRYEDLILDGYPSENLIIKDAKGEVVDLYVKVTRRRHKLLTHIHSDVATSNKYKAVVIYVGNDLGDYSTITLSDLNHACEVDRHASSFFVVRFDYHNMATFYISSGRN